MKPALTLEHLKTEAQNFAQLVAREHEAALYGVTDGKAIGTYVEHKFRTYLHDRYTLTTGSSASGIDFPDLEVDMKVTSIRQPQSSCPFKSARQKIYGLGYALLIFAYEKTDDPQTLTGHLDIVSVVFVDKGRTADFQTTVGLHHLLEHGANKDDILAFLEERRLPVDEIEASALADEILAHPPDIGYLTISNALQWRLQYSRVIEKAGSVTGLERLR